MVKRVSDDLAKAFYAARDQGLSLSTLSANFKISLATVKRLNRRRIGLSQIQLKQQDGRPRATNARTDRAIHLALKRRRFQPFAKTAREFQVSINTIRRRATSRGLQTRRAVRDVLRRHHRTARVSWCRAHAGTDFSHWIFSDEVLFELADCSAPRTACVRRKSGEKYARACILPAPVQSRQKVMLWGCITKSGEYKFGVVHGAINSASYIGVLRENLLPLLDTPPINLARYSFSTGQRASSSRCRYSRVAVGQRGCCCPLACPQPGSQPHRERVGSAETSSPQNRPSNPS